MLSACQNAVEPTGSLATATESVDVGRIPINPEEIKGKIDVYTSIARASKYNINDMANYMNSRVDEVFLQNVSADKIVTEVKASGQKGRHQIYDSLRALDFAVIFANSKFIRDRAYVRENSYSKAGQTLSLNAIKSHKSVMFAHKKSKEIGRIVSMEKKKIDALNEKFDKKGMLSEAELEYKKGLEVAVYKLNMMKDELAVDVKDYSQLIKATENDKLSLEGRMFYETEFDKSLRLDVFQKIAVKNRKEFIAFLEVNKGKDYNFSTVENMSLKKYPEVERMIINGYSFGDEVYVRALQIRADKVSRNLIDMTYAFDRMYNNADKIAGSELADELSIAIFTQVELAYNAININTIGISELTEELKKLQDELKALEKNKKSDKNYIDILNKKLDVFRLEYQISNLVADRATAIRALYFYSGFDMFDDDFLDNSISGIAKELRVLYNKENVETLSSVDKVSEASKEKLTQKQNNEWAREDKWLETLVDGNKDKKYGRLPPPPAQQKYNEYLKTLESSRANYQEHYNDSHRDRKIMQLGAYSNVENANNNWSNIYNMYPEARTLIPEIETVMVNGKEIHRLIVKSTTADLVKLCNMIRSDGLECILK